MNTDHRGVEDTYLCCDNLDFLKFEQRFLRLEELINWKKDLSACLNYILLLLCVIFLTNIFLSTGRDLKYVCSIGSRLHFEPRTKLNSCTIHSSVTHNTNLTLSFVPCHVSLRREIIILCLTRPEWKDYQIFFFGPFMRSVGSGALTGDPRSRPLLIDDLFTSHDFSNYIFTVNSVVVCKIWLISCDELT